MRTRNNNLDNDPVFSDWVLLLIGVSFSAIILLMIFEGGVSVLFKYSSGSGLSRLNGIPLLLMLGAFILMIVFPLKRIINRRKKKTNDY